jgi:hypothetical protein
MRQLNRNFRTSAIMMAVMSAVIADGALAAGGVAAEVVKPTLTRAQKQAAQIEVLEKRIAADTAKLAEVKLDIETASRLDGVVAGSAIIARIGRAETSKEVAARVLGIKEDDNGSRRYKIAFGEGFDADAAIIQASQIIRVLVEDAVAEVAAEPTPVGYVDNVEVGRNEYDQPINSSGEVIAA